MDQPYFNSACSDARIARCYVEAHAFRADLAVQRVMQLPANAGDVGATGRKSSMLRRDADGLLAIRQRDRWSNCIEPHQRAKLERLCRYVSRPQVSTERMAPAASGHVRYNLKSRCRDGTTHIALEPLDLMARLASA